MILEMCIVQGSLQVIVHKEVASLWSEARTGATAAPEKSAIQSFEFWTELCIALLRRGGGVTWKGPIESRASRGSGSWQPCALYSSHRHIAIPVMRWMTTQLKVGISQLSKLLGPAIVKIVTICKKLARDHLSYALYSSHRQILVMICMALARG